MEKELSFKGKKVIIFDLDGTIVNLFVDWYGLKEILSENYSERYEQDCDFESISACLSFVVSKKDDEELRRSFEIIEEHELEAITKNKFIKETVFFINNLEMFGVTPDTKLAVLSLNMRKMIIESLKQAGIYDKFDFIVGREDVRRWKPEPEGLFIIETHYKISKDKLMFIGDLEKDIVTGRNAGIDAYLIGELIDLVNTKRKK